MGKTSASVPGNPTGQGLWRTILAGPGRSLGDVFTNLEKAPQVERVVRHPARGLVCARVNLTPSEGNGYWELTRIREDFYVVIWNFVYKNPRFELVPGDGLVQFNFRVTGDLTLGVSNAERLRFNKPSLLVWAQAPDVQIPEWTAPSAQERMVVISVKPEFLLEHFATSAADMPAPLQAYLSKPSGQVNYCHFPLTARMFDIATRLINNPYRGALALVHTEALTLELLCAAVAGFSGLSGLPAEEYSDHALRALQTARNVIAKQLSPPPTISALARHVGLAEKSLTRGFKAFYGQTIFEFSLRCRMQQALQLLRDQHWTVDRVSDAVGYSHPTSFATAFRRHFGLRPIDVKRLKT